MSLTNNNEIVFDKVRREDDPEGGVVIVNNGEVAASGHTLHRCEDCWMNGNRGLFEHQKGSGDIPICPECGGGNTDLIVLFTSADFNFFLNNIV